MKRDLYMSMAKVEEPVNESYIYEKRIIHVKRQ